MHDFSDSISFSDMEIEKYCQSVEELLNSITSKKNASRIRDVADEEYAQMDDSFEDLL